MTWHPERTTIKLLSLKEQHHMVESAVPSVYGIVLYFHNDYCDSTFAYLEPAHGRCRDCPQCRAEPHIDTLLNRWTVVQISWCWRLLGCWGSPPDEPCPGSSQWYALVLPEPQGWLWLFLLWQGSIWCDGKAGQWWELLGLGQCGPTWDNNIMHQQMKWFLHVNELREVKQLSDLFICGFVTVNFKLYNYIILNIWVTLHELFTSQSTLIASNIFHTVIWSIVPQIIPRNIQ